MKGEAISATKFREVGHLSQVEEVEEFSHSDLIFDEPQDER